MNPGGWAAGAVPTTKIADQSPNVQRAQARVVQHHYVRAQLREINVRKGNALIEATLEALKQLPQGRKCTRDQLLKAFWVMTERLQTADLTINFSAPKWFTAPNNTSSYQQMYERAVRDVQANGQPGIRQMRLNNSDLKNPATMRVDADNKATFPNGMMDGGGFARTFGGIGRVMAPGRLVEPTVDVQQGKAELEASNPYFNPLSKQVFAALNYGRRPHGSTTTYGRSYLVLNKKFKTNAIYFSGDTFFNKIADMRCSADDQVSFDLLGAAYAKACPALRQDIYKSCMLLSPLSDAMPSAEYQLLLEAHLFEPLSFSGNIKVIYLSASDMVDGQKPTVPEWLNILTNARSFAMKHGAKLVPTD
jgi:hypothetical protein